MAIVTKIFKLNISKGIYNKENYSEEEFLLKKFVKVKYMLILYSIDYTFDMHLFDGCNSKFYDKVEVD